VPDVAFMYDSGLIDEGRFIGGLSPEELRRRLKPLIAKKLDCKDNDGKPIVHQPHQITFISFSPLPDHGDKLVVMQIFAYDWPDRLRNIDKRMAAIGEFVRKRLKLPEHSVDVSFIEIHRGSPGKAPAWINV
jgi:hypothetical protein